MPDTRFEVQRSIAAEPAAIFEILIIVFSLKPSKNIAGNPARYASRSACRISRASAGRNSGRR